MLARARFRDDALFAHAPREQDLAEGVVDLMRAGVEQIFALQINLRAAELLREALGKVERRGPSAVVAEQAVEFGVKGGIGLGALVFGGEFEQRGHQRLGHEHAAELAEVAVPVGERLEVDHRSGKVGARFRRGKGFPKKPRA